MPRGTSLYDEALIQGRLWNRGLLRPGVLVASLDPTLPYVTPTVTTLATSLNDLSGNGATETAGTTGSQPSYLAGAINGVAALVF